MLPLGDRISGDTRTYEDGDYYLSQEFVNQYAYEVKARPTTLKRKRREIQAEGCDDDDADDSQVVPVSDTGEGDPTDGLDVTKSNNADQCVKNWKAAASDEKKRSWAVFDETGIYASVCRHHTILWICDMVRSGELYTSLSLCKMSYLPPSCVVPSIPWLSLQKHWKCLRNGLQMAETLTVVFLLQLCVPALDLSFGKSKLHSQ